MRTTINSQLMKNHVAGTVLQKQKYLGVAYTSDDSPILFSLNDVGLLQVTLPSTSSPMASITSVTDSAPSATGWEQVNLTKQLADLGTLGASPVVQCFAVSQDADGSIWLVIGASTAKNGPSQVFISPKMPNTGFAADWSSLGSKLVQRPVAKNLVLSHITIGTADDMATAPLIVAAGNESAGGMVVHYQINPDPGDSSWGCMPLILPQNATRCLASAVGNVPELGRGVYMLCELGPGLNLTFTTMPQFFGEHLVTESIELAIPCGLMPSSIAALAVEGGQTELYVAGNGLVRYPVSAQTESHLPPISISDSKQFSGIQQLLVDRDAAGIEVGIWGVNISDQLVHTVGTHNGQDYTWQVPLFIASEVTAIATCRTYDTGTDISIVNVVTGKTDGSLALVTQDSGTMLWRSQAVAIKSTRDVVELPTYTVRIAVMDDDGIALGGQNVGLQPSFDCSALVNGQYYALKSSVSKAATTNAAGTITVVLQTPDTSAPVFTITAGSNTAQQTDPSASVASKLRAINTRDQIKNAVRSDGKPVFPGGIADDRCDVALSALGNLMQAHDSLPTTPPSGHLRRAAAVAAAARGVNIRQLRCVSCTGYRLQGDEPAIMRHEEALADLVARNGLSDFLVSVGDLFATIGSWIEKAAKFFVAKLEQGWAFIVDLGDRMLHAIFEVASQVFGAIKWIFKEVLGIDLDEIIAWLGFVFNWGDILNNHKVIAKTVNLTFQKTVTDIQASKETMKKAFETVRSKLINDKLVVDLSNEVFDKRVRSNPVQENATDSAEANWGLHQFEVNSGSITHSDTVIGDIENLFSDLTETQIQIIQIAVSQFQRQILDNFDRMSFREILNQFFDIVGAVLINTAENVAMTFLDAMQLLVSALQALLNTRWNIPVLTYVYEEIICQGDGSKLTLIDVVSLLTSIPATILYKSITNTNMFTVDQTSRALAANTWDDFIGVFSKQKLSYAERTEAVTQESNDAAAALGISAGEACALAFQCVSTACRIVSASLSVISDFMEKGPKVDIVGRVKVCFDWAVYASSLANFVIVTVSKGKATARYVLDGILTNSQVLLRLKDTFLVVWKYKKNADSPLRNGLSYAESVFGVVFMITSVVSFALELYEGVPAGIKPTAFGVLVGFKLDQNIFSGAHSGLAFMPNLKDEKIRLVGIAIRGALTIGRAGLSTARCIGEPIAKYVDTDL
ncbi:MAG TPA: hypothetical protein PLS48_06485 [Methanotrichaceae archaeon]|nr:hypothetical protein [Methanotrichaceae archaeon]